MEWQRNPDGTRIREEGATIEMRFNADEQYRARMEEMGWTEENIHEMDEQVQALEAFDEQREEDALWAQRFSSGASSAGSEESKGKGKTTGFKGGYMGTGWRSREDRVYAGHWKQVRYPRADPGQARHLSEEQWRLAQQYQHQGVYQLPPAGETDTLADIAEEEEETVYYPGAWHQGWQGWRWQQQSWWWEGKSAAAQALPGLEPPFANSIL